MTDPSNRLAVLGVLLATFIAAPASADDPKPAAANPAAAEAKAKGTEARAERAADKADKAGGKAEDKAEKAADKADKAADKAEARSDKVAGRGHFRSAMAQLHADLKEGKIKPAEVKERLAKLRDDAKDRKKAHREAIKERWGDALAKPNALQELKHHARRMAFLNRALILAETERKAKDKDKLVERIEKLIEKENERHAKAMERIKSGQPGPNAAASAAPGTAPAAAPATAAPATAPAKAGTEPQKAGGK